MASANSDVDVYTQWTELLDDDLSVSLLHDVLEPIDDDLWVAAACVDRIVDAVDVQRALLELGLSRTDSAVERCKAYIANPPLDDDNDEDEGGPSDRSRVKKSQHSLLTSCFANSEQDAQLCAIREVLLQRLDRLRTYEEIAQRMPEEIHGEALEEEPGEAWEDDPWADDEAGRPDNVKSASVKSPIAPPLSLSVFLTEPLSVMLYALATRSQFAALCSIYSRHHSLVFPWRLLILNRIPYYADSSEFHDLLPAVDLQTGNEVSFPSTPWRTTADWTESAEVQHALRSARILVIHSSEIEGEDNSNHLHPSALTAEEILSWYTTRVEAILKISGMVDVALSLVQHGISQGISGLDEVGEDLTLISRMVYDTRDPDGQSIVPMSISAWRSMDPPSAIKRYLASSTPETIVADIRRLVMPYLFVLEARCERAGKPDPGLIKRLLYGYVLDASLEMDAAIFEASKPTLVASQRLVSVDEDLARLALARLYGSSSVDEWSTMSRVFECLPAWNFEADADSGDEADTTITSLGAFLAPTTSRPQCTPSDLLVFFSPLPVTSLSRALDILDVHLESGEILAKWNAPATLRFLLQSVHDEAQQRAWATRMVRQAASLTDELQNEDDWLSLLEDMLKLARPGSDFTYSAFGALSKDDIRRIFFSGILSSGKFDIAKRILRNRKGGIFLAEEVVESICLDCSREFFDNASSGNYNFGEMKLAYDCLGVSSSSPAIQKEREFIEATSRIASFNVMSRPGVPILPIEIRLAKDKLSLVSRVLSSNESAYKHTEVVLELMRKLGYHGDIVAEVKTLAMIADTALQAEDFPRAFAASERMVDTVLEFRKSYALGSDNLQVKEAVEVCWVACYQLGRQAEVEETDRKMSLLGRALELCPPDRIADVLTAWRKLEAQDIEERQRKADERSSRTSKAAKQHRGRTSTLAARLHDLQMPSISPSLPSAPAGAAALASQASHAFSRVAATFPFSNRERTSGGSRSPSRDRSERRAGSPDVQAQARHALQRGIGWLIGADEDELQ